MLAAFAGIGAAMGAGSLVRSAASDAQQLQNLSNELGVSTQRMFQLQAAARQTGTELGTLYQAARRISDAIEDPGGVGKKAAEALTDMGVSLRGGVGQAFDQAIDKLSKMRDLQKQNAEAAALFGRDGVRMGLVAHELDNVGASMDATRTSKRVDANHKLEQLNNMWMILKANMASGLITTISVASNMASGSGGAASGGGGSLLNPYGFGSLFGMLSGPGGP
jgi:hypothetical protein